MPGVEQVSQPHVLAAAQGQTFRDLPVDQRDGQDGYRPTVKLVQQERPEPADRRPENRRVTPRATAPLTASSGAAPDSNALLSTPNSWLLQVRDHGVKTCTDSRISATSPRVFDSVPPNRRGEPNEKRVYA